MMRQVTKRQWPEREPPGRMGEAMKAEHLKAFLMRPLLPEDTRIRLRQQCYDAEAANRSRRILTTPDLAVTIAVAVDGAGTGDNATPWSSYRSAIWNGQKVVVPGWRGKATSVQWFPQPGGFLPGFDPADVARAGVRPAPSGECPSRIAAIATVGLAGHHVSRLYFLDAECHDLLHSCTRLSPEIERGLEDDLISVADSAGIAYRRYALTLARYSSLRVSPEKVCDVLFPRSARRVRLGSEEEDWYTEYPWWGGAGRAGGPRPPPQTHATYSPTQGAPPPQ